MNKMNCYERMKSVLEFKKPDRLPVFELSGWWGETVKNWKQQGLDWDAFWNDSYGYMGMDRHYCFYIVNKTDKFVFPEHVGAPQVADEAEYDEFKKEHLFPVEYVRNNAVNLQFMNEMQAAGEASVWLNFEGFFWFPRTLFGIEPHLYAFYDYPELMHKMNREYSDFLLLRLDEVFEYVTPLFAVVSEDMSYNHGPMCSKECFDEFIKPYYIPLVKKLKDKGVKVLVDTDGNPTDMIDWFLEVGVEGFTPNERQAGTDIVDIRKKYPELLLMGGFNKTIMDKGEKAIREEFERIFPVMCQGGYIPGCDHQTPPNVTLEDYFIYQKVQREYCRKAAECWKL